MAAGTVILIAPVFFFYHRRRRPTAPRSLCVPREPAAARSRSGGRLSTTDPSHDKFPQRVEHDLERADEWLEQEVATSPAHAEQRRQDRDALAHLALLAALALGLAFGFGQGRSSYSKSGASFGAIERSLTEQGLRICSRQSVEVTRLRGVQAAETLVLGFHSCPSSTSSNVNRLTAYRFSSSETRDAAVRGSLGARQPGSVWTYAHT